MSDSLNKVLSKLVTSIEGVKNEREMLLRLIIGLAVFLLLAVFKKQISKAVVWLCTKTLARKSELAQKALVDALSTPLSFFVLVLGIYIGTEIIAPSGEIRSPVLLIFKLGIIFSIAWFLINFINSDFSFVLKDDDSKTKKTAVNFISNLIKIIVVIISALLMLEQFGISATRVFAALGIGGVAVAFACKDAVENLLSGFIIIYDKPFEVDDFIKIDNEVGQVEEIKIRTTRLRMTDGSQKIYPNTTVANSAIINLSRMSHRLVNETLGIEYKHSAKEIDAFCNKLRSLINSYKEVDKTDVRVNFVNYSDSSLDIEVFFYADIQWSLREWSLLKNGFFYADIVPLAEFFDFKTKFNCDVKALADSMNIDFAFDSRSLYFANELKIKNNEKLVEKQDKREENYQKLLSDMTEKYSVVEDIRNSVDEIQKKMEQISIEQKE